MSCCSFSPPFNLLLFFQSSLELWHGERGWFEIIVAGGVTIVVIIIDVDLKIKSMFQFNLKKVLSLKLYLNISGIDIISVSVGLILSHGGPTTASQDVVSGRNFRCFTRITLFRTLLLRLVRNRGQNLSEKWQHFIARSVKISRSKSYLKFCN